MHTTSGVAHEAPAPELPVITLTEEQKQRLLQMARQAIVAYLDQKTLPVLAVSDPVLKQDAGVFVTLWRRDVSPARLLEEPWANLRGCVGHPETDSPLSWIVPEMAIKAALFDPRFPPVTSDELERLRIEISVLSPLVRIDDVNQIEVGRHGLVIEGSGRRGLLLPEVPVRRGWGRQAFLQALCNKAGLPQDYWHNPAARLYAFATVTFEE